MSGHSHSLSAPKVSRKSPAPALLTGAGLLSFALFAGGFLGLQSIQATRNAVLLDDLSRRCLWLHGAAGSRPRREWQPVAAAMDADWTRLAAAAPPVAKALDDHWRSVDSSLQNRNRLGWAAADRFSQSADTQAGIAAQQARRDGTDADRLILAGAGGLSLCFVGSLALGRRQRLTQFQTIQSYLAAERTAWENQRSASDAQRDQLIAELQQAQQHKAELDTLRQHGSRQFEEFFRTLPVACFCVAATGKVVRWNSACESLYGYAAADVLDRPLWETIVPGDERERVEKQLSRVLSGDALTAIDRQDRHADGSPRPVRCSLAPLRDSSGQIIGSLSANQALAEAASHEQQIAAQQASLQQMQSLLQIQQEEMKALRRRQETTPQAPGGQAVPTDTRTARDPVTGLRPHSDFQEHVRTEFERMARYNTPASLVLIDLDHFGHHNEVFGYRSGDQALRSIAEMLNTKVRSVDIVARYGPDELAVLLPETGRAGALVAAERFRAGIAGIAWAGKPMTASLGVAVLTPDLPHPQAFVAKAMAALRASAGSGADRLVCADS